MDQQPQNVPNFHWEEKDAFTLDVVDKARPFEATSQKSELKYPLISNLIIIGKCLTTKSQVNTRLSLILLKSKLTLTAAQKISQTNLSQTEI
jgi:hypothetical protein